MKRLAIFGLCLLIVLAARAQEPSRYLQVKYDKFDDRTVVALWEMPLAQGVIGWLPAPMGNNPAPLTLTLVHNFPSQHPKESLRPEDPMYVRLSSERVVGLVSPPTLNLIIDGERLTLATKWKTDGRERPDDKSVLLPVTYSLLLRLISAKKVEGRLGITEFHITSRNQDDMRDFVKAINP
jgi:hypothetical protein